MDVVSGLSGRSLLAYINLWRLSNPNDPPFLFLPGYALHGASCEFRYSSSTETVPPVPYTLTPLHRTEVRLYVHALRAPRSFPSSIYSC